MSRKNRIEQRLYTELNPVFLSVEDESSYHRVPNNAETHFKVRVVASQFSTLSAIERHRLIYRLLDEEFSRGLHALSLDLYTIDEWSLNQNSTKSPLCKGGFEN